MQERLFYISELIGKELNETITVDEANELNEWVNSSVANKTLFDQLHNDVFVKQQLEKFDSYDIERNRVYLMRKLGEEVASRESLVVSPSRPAVADFDCSDDPVSSLLRIKRIKLWKRIAVAASFFGLLFVGYWLVKDKTTENGPQTIVSQTNDVKAPVSNRAMITLANGEQVYIDSALDRETVLQGNMKLIKLPTGEITYVLEGTVSTESMSYNTVSNPRGSKVLPMQLADGTRFWLNVGSSLTYPVVFTGDVRKVEITGEAYFEVAHNDKMPFVVAKGQTEIKVLGTHFNVNAYDDEKELKVTLLEGAVQVQKAGEGVLLKPGQQAEVEGGIKLVDGVDTDLVMAWKNGMFAFHDASVQEVMRQLARWYDVTVKYEGTIPVHAFRGKIQRDNTLSVVLQILAEANIHYKINGNEIIVTK